MNYFPALFHGFIPKIPSLLKLPFPPYDAGYLNKPFPPDQECFAIMKRNISPLQNSALAPSSTDILPPLFTVMPSSEPGFSLICK